MRVHGADQPTQYCLSFCTATVSDCNANALEFSQQKAWYTNRRGARKGYATRFHKGSQRQPKIAALKAANISTYESQPFVLCLYDQVYLDKLLFYVML